MRVHESARKLQTTARVQGRHASPRVTGCRLGHVAVHKRCGMGAMRPRVGISGSSVPLGSKQERQQAVSCLAASDGAA